LNLASKVQELGHLATFTTHHRLLFLGGRGQTSAALLGRSDICIVLFLIGLLLRRQAVTELEEDLEVLLDGEVNHEGEEELEQQREEDGRRGHERNVKPTTKLYENLGMLLILTEQ